MALHARDNAAGEPVYRVPSWLTRECAEVARRRQRAGTYGLVASGIVSESGFTGNEHIAG
jgi:hypothetical protein